MTERSPKFRRRAEARPNEILDAALALFAEQGVERTRVEDVARRAGLSKGSVYLYYPSKEALLEGLVRRAVVPVADEMLAMLRSYRGDPRPLLAGVMRMLPSRLLDAHNARLLKLILREAVVSPQIAGFYRREVLERVVPAVSALIAQGVEAGHIRAVDPELTVRSLIGPLLAHILLSEVFGMEPAGGFRLDDLVDNHLKILMAGLAPEAR